MRVRLTRVMAAAALMPLLATAATFGTVVQVHGAVSDIALDETRGHLYAANFAAYRVEVIGTANGALLTPITVSAPPSAVAVSPDGHYLVVGLYQSPSTSSACSPGGFPLGGFQPNTGGLEIIDLTTGAVVQNISLPNPVLSVTFGSDGNALVVISVSQESLPLQPNVFLLSPSTGNLQTLTTIPVYSRILPQCPTQGETDLLASVAPSQIIQTAAAVSTDKNTITILGASVQDDAATSPFSQLLRYNVPTQTMTVYSFETTPPMGPRSVASDATGANVMSGWALNKFLSSATCLVNPPVAQVGPGPCEWAQVGALNGAFQLGSHAWDVTRNLIYSQIPAPNEGHVLNIMATDNLTVQERLQMSEDLAGKSLMSSDGNTMYSVSASGVTIFPIGQLPQTPQVGAAQEDLLFADTGNGCTAGLWTQTLTINSLSSVPADFTLSLPQGTTGVTLSQTTGTTPAQVLVTIDPLAFQTAKGTTTIPLTITSNAAVNLPPAVRLLINMRGATQVGRIFNVPGKIVDMLADPVRGRLYLLRQDKNLVKVFDMATLTELADLRTGNTPTQMALTLDNNYLLVGNDNSMIANVFDLNALAPAAPILFPYGHYPRSVGITISGAFALMRNAGLINPSPCKGDTPIAVLDQIDFANRVAYTPCTLNGATNPAIYSNSLTSFDGVIAPSGDGLYITLSLADSTVAEYDATAGAWVASRKDFSSLLGSYGALNDQLWNAGPNLLDAALVPVGTPFPSTDGTPSGVAPFLGIGVRTSATAATDPGIVQLIDTINYTELNATLMAEAPVTQASLLTAPVGQIGQTILSFTRSLALSPDQSTIYALTISGLTILPSNFYVPPSVPIISSIVSTADNASPAATGGLISIWGTNLSGTSQPSSGFPLATSLGSACVTANGEPLPLYYASPFLVNAQVPYDIVGSASVVVQSPAGVSAPFSLSVQPVAPAIFLNTTASPGTSIPFITRLANGLLVTPSNPVHPGDTLQIYLAGMGQTTPPATAGVATPATPPETVAVLPTVTIGGANAQVTVANLTPGEAGVYQVDVTVSNQTPLGLSIPLTISQGGISQTIQVRVVK